MNLLTIKMTIMRKMRRVCEGVQEVEKYLPSWKFTELTLMMALRMRMRRRKSWTSPNQLLPTSQTKKEVQKATKLFANKSKVIKLLICLWPLECPKQGGILTRPLGFYFLSLHWPVGNTDQTPCTCLGLLLFYYWPVQNPLHCWKLEH